MKNFLIHFLIVLFLIQITLPAWAKGHKDTDADYNARSEKSENWLFDQMPGDLGGDLKESFWGWGGLAFLAGIGATAGLYTKDDSIKGHFRNHPLFGKSGDKIFGIGGNPFVLGGASVLTWGISGLTKNKKFQLTGESFVESVFLAEALTGGAKFAFRRDRPNGGSLGFPSAHTSGAFAIASVLEVMYGLKAGLPAYATASLIGLSRMDNNDHFASDVLMGAFIGGVIGWGTAALHKKKYLPVEIIPMVDKKTSGITVSYQF